jgi:hypothetical protein
MQSWAYKWEMQFYKSGWNKYVSRLEQTHGKFGLDRVQRQPKRTFGATLAIPDARILLMSLADGRQ